MLLVVARARAQAVAEAPVAAEALFAEGRRLMALARYEEACVKFRESQRLDSGIGTLMNLARCYAKLGRSASAWATYRQAAALARAAGQRMREQVARREAEALEATLAKVKIRVAQKPFGLGVSLDSVPVGEELWELGTPVDPGEHVLLVRAPDHEAWTERINVSPQEIRVLEVPPLTPSPTDRSRPAVGWRAQHTMAVIQAGVGVSAAVLGGLLAYSAHSDYEDSDAGCPDNVCDDRAFATRERGILRARMATISFVIAGSALAGASVVWFASPPLELKRSAGARKTAHSRWSVGIGAKF